MSTQEIGHIRQEFKPGLENVVAGFIIGLLLIGGGCAVLFFAARMVIESRGSLPLWVEKGESWGAVGILSAIGIGLIVGGVFLILWMRSLASLRVSLGSEGLSITRKGETRIITWPDIVSVQETHLYERVAKGVVGHALPRALSKNYTLHVREGEPFQFDVNAIKGHVILAGMIKKQMDQRNIPWEIVEEYQ